MVPVSLGYAMQSPWQMVSGGVTSPQGFQASGIAAGLKPSGKLDMALLLAPEQAVCAGSFTTSVVRAACVDLCAERLAASGGKARAVLINSGQANACTGDRGLIDSQRSTQALADRLGLDAEAVLICSTGVIGVPIPMPTVPPGSPSLPPTPPPAIPPPAPPAGADKAPDPKGQGTPPHPPDHPLKGSCRKRKCADSLHGKRSSPMRRRTRALGLLHVCRRCSRRQGLTVPP